MTKDKIFWAIKFYVEDTIKQQGEYIPIPYQTIEEFAFAKFTEKEKSTLRAKCRAIWYWYDKRNWVIENYEPPRWNYQRKTKDDKELLMTRIENIKKIHKNKKEITRKKILNLITGMFKNDYIKKDLSYNVSRIAKDTNLSRPTIIKHLKELKEEGLI